MEKQVVAIRCIKNKGVLPLWTDSIAVCWYAGQLHFIGGAVNALNGSKLHYIYNFDGTTLTLTNTITGPFTGTNEATISLLNGKLTLIGGTTSNEIWDYDPSRAGKTASSWIQKDADLTLSIGGRKMAAGIDLGTYHYQIGGWGNQTVYKTQNFTAWTLVGNTPANIPKWAGGGFCAHKGKGYLVGGAKNVAADGSDYLQDAQLGGYVYCLDPAGDTWTLVSTDDKHKTVWCDIGSDGTNLWMKQGKLPSTDKNLRGLYKSTDDGATWSSVSVHSGTDTLFETHRSSMCLTPYGLIITMGFNANNFWVLE